MALQSGMVIWAEVLWGAVFSSVSCFFIKQAI
jgi:hypothetical protein